jgi:hypothetical protein
MQLEYQQQLIALQQFAAAASQLWWTWGWVWLRAPQAPSSPVILFNTRIQNIRKTINVSSGTPRPVNPKPVNPKPVNPKPVNPKPVNPKPVNPKPVNPKPVNPKPVNPKPVKPAPAKPPSVGPHKDHKKKKH